MVSTIIQEEMNHTKGKYSYVIYIIYGKQGKFKEGKITSTSTQEA